MVDYMKMSQIRKTENDKIEEKSLLTLPAELIFKTLESLYFDDCQ